MIRLFDSIRVILTLVTLAPLYLSAAPRNKPSPVPDFTKGDPIGERQDWNLGATGARGWMWGWKEETTNARQIYITKVDKGSPAKGILVKGDVILGVDGKLFSYDARYALSAAITTAEAKTGKLNILRWRKGKTESVTLQLEALGAYTESAPFNCTKSQKILDAGCKHIAAKMRSALPRISAIKWNDPQKKYVYNKKDIGDLINALALLASGKPEYNELVRKFAYAFGPKDIMLNTSPETRMASWGWGYTNLFLCEYHLATGDQAVLPAIRAYSIAIANGQSFIGTWGHTMAWPQINGGKLHGSLSGYGALNAPGLACHLSLVLAEKCGVKHAKVSQAIHKANQFIGFYAGKGSIPYGDHMPEWKWHDDNGKNSMAAVIFDLQEPTNLQDHGRFFTAMTVASYGERKKGHTGNYFSLMWGPLGAQRGGDEATAAFLKPQREFYDFNRTWKGSFPYQAKPNAGPGENSYRGWDSTSAFMLSYALPLRKLYITGKGIRKQNSIKGNTLSMIIAAGEGYNRWDDGLNHYHKKSTSELLNDLKSWSPAVRLRASKALSKKDGEKKIINSLLSMLDSDVLYTRYGACQAIGAIGSNAKQAVPKLQKLLLEDDLWLRIQAVSALTNIGEASSSAIPKLLKLILRQDRHDPLEMTQRFLAHGLFGAAGIYGNAGLLRKDLKGVDKKLLYQVVRKILQNPDGHTRGTADSVYQLLSYEEIKPILPAILIAIKEPSPSGVMFSNGIRISGLKILAKHRIREGLPLCFEVLELDKWGKEGRVKHILKIITSYGSAAKSVLPQLKKLEQDLLKHKEAKMLAPYAKSLQQLIKDLESSKKKDKPLRSIHS